jgi:ATP-binding cassette subfamily B protein
MTTVPLVQAFGRERYEEERFEAESAEHLQETIRNARIEAVVTRAVTVIGALGTAAVVFYGSMQVLAGSLTPGDLLIFTSYTQSMFKPVRNLAKLSTRFSKASIGAERISGILEIEPGIQDKPDAIEVPTLRGAVSFENVSFDYADDADGVLRDVSFTANPGQRVALVGPSGAGKSTLISLILRLYEPQEGAVFVDGIDIRDYKRRSLRRQIGIVLQDSVLFGATVRENIAYGRLDATQEEIEAAANAANAHEFITRLDSGYDTVIGERGDTLSGGQKRKVDR